MIVGRNESGACGSALFLEYLARALPGGKGGGVYQMECSLWYALTVCVFPFAAVDVVKIVAAALAGGAVRRQLIKARLMKTDAEQSK